MFHPWLDFFTFGCGRRPRWLTPIRAPPRRAVVRGRGQVGNLVLKAPNCGETRVFTMPATPHPALAASEKGEPEAVRPRRRLGVKRPKCNRDRYSMESANLNRAQYKIAEHGPETARTISNRRVHVRQPVQADTTARKGNELAWKRQAPIDVRRTTKGVFALLSGRKA